MLQVAEVEQRKRNQLIVLTEGREDDGKRATLAFALAISLQSMGTDVAIYLDSEAVVWSLQGAARGVTVKGFDTLESYISFFEGAGGQLFVHFGGLCQLDGWSEDKGTHREYGGLRPRVTRAGVATLASLLLQRSHLAF